MRVTAVRVEQVQSLPHGAKVMVDGIHEPVIVWIDASVSPDEAAILAEQALAEYSGE